MSGRASGSAQSGVDGAHAPGSRHGQRAGRRSRPVYKTPAGEQAVMAVYDRILATCPPSTESLNIETRHGRTHVLAQGRADGRPLVLLHGAGSNALAWGGDIPELARHFRVYAVETPGEPGRSCQERIPWPGEGIVEWLGDVIDGVSAGSTAAGPGGGGGAAADGAAGSGAVSRPGAAAPAARVLLAGISQGGYIALRFACARPERVQALVLLAPGGVSPVRPGFLARGLTYGLLGRRGSAALTRVVMGDSEVPETAVDYMNLIFTHFRSRMDAQPLLSDAELRRLSMPVLLMVGAKDALFDSDKTASRLRRLVERVDVRLLPDTGHAIINVAATVGPFLVAC